MSAIHGMAKTRRERSARERQDILYYEWKRQPSRHASKNARNEKAVEH